MPAFIVCDLIAHVESSQSQPRTSQDSQHATLALHVNLGLTCSLPGGLGDDEVIRNLRPPVLQSNLIYNRFCLFHSSFDNEPPRRLRYNPVEQDQT